MGERRKTFLKGVIFPRKKRGGITCIRPFIMVQQTSRPNTIRSDVPFFPRNHGEYRESPEREGKRGSDYWRSRPPKTKRYTLHSSGQASNSHDWEIDELKVSKRHAVTF